jgi:hypothetical protein
MEGISWGDVPGWLGALGALVVGAAAIVISVAQFRIAEQQTQIAKHQANIAAKQFEHEQFRPLIKAYCDEARRVAVQVVNQGAGSGQVQDLNLMLTGISSACGSLSGRCPGTPSRHCSGAFLDWRFADGPAGRDSGT